MDVNVFREELTRCMDTPYTILTLYTRINAYISFTSVKL